MAQTKKKRSTKHRGNAAGVVEARGRTGRKLTDEEKGKNAAASGKGAPRGDRFDRPPTWRGAAQRSLIAVVIFIAVIVLLFKQDPAPAVALGAALLIVYIPMSFYTDLWLYRRRQAKKLEGGGGKPKKGSA
ncbi:MAG TPA: hypothetical protein PKD63_10660 [Solirubrobacteraceae bacterium]|nr:hypothetical protein [Solirubrobacteraceae bacterium]